MTCCYEFIESLNFLPHVICLSETRIKKNPLINIELTNYSFVHVNSKSNAGGVSIYIRKNLNYEISENQHVLTNSESLWITITENLLSYSVGIIYWHPSSSDVQAFIEDFSICLKELNISNSSFYILGGLNINTSTINRTPVAKRFLNMLLSCGVLPLITKPTRVSDNSATIIDHILTNDYEHFIIPGIITTNEISDHCPILCHVNLTQTRKKADSTLTFYRDKSKFVSHQFNAELNTSLTDFFIQLPLLTKDNFNEIFNRFNHLILQVVDKNAPLKKVSRKQKNLHKKPWLSHKLLKAIKDKPKMYKTHFLNGNSAQKELYKRFLNKLTKMKTRGKRNYFESELQNHSGNPKKTWKIFKSLLPNKSFQNV